MPSETSAISQGTYSSHICAIIHIYIWIHIYCFQAYIGQSTIATFPVILSSFLSPASFWNCIITDSTDIGFRTEQMVLIGMRSLRLDSDWLTWAWAKNNLWFFYTCVCALEIEESERKTEGEGEKGRAQRRREKLFISCFAPPALPHLSLSLRDSGLIKRATSFVFFWAIEQPTTQPNPCPNMNEEHCELCLPISSSPSLEGQHRGR